MSRGDLDGEDDAGGEPAWPGWRASAVALGLYAACLAAATFPAVAQMGSRFPLARADPLMHLWVMRWYKSCALEGRLPFASPDIQSPVGAPLGHFSPMHLQGLLYFPMSAVSGNDVLIYNLLWLGGFLFTGMATFVLARRVTGEDAAAWLAGLLAMLCTPMTVHAVAHLELIYAGGFSLFLASWLAFVDRPDRRRLAAAVSTLVLMTMCAAYFIVLAMPPASLYLAWRAAGERGKAGRWLASRAGWLAGFAAAAVPPLALLFGSQFWAIAHGESMRREWSQFAFYKAAGWSYAVPTPFHALGRLLPFDVYARSGFGGVRMGEGASYLGVVALGLLAYAAVGRVRFPRASYWWASLAMLVVLSMGASCEVGSLEVPLPARWLWKYVPLYRLTRNPGRFNLLACQCAAVIAAAALAHLLRGVRRPGVRVAVVAGLAVAVTADLRSDVFVGSAIPPLPGFYRTLMASGSRPNLLEVPMAPSGAVDVRGSACAYWQSFHRGRTSAGYSGHDNDPFNERVYHGSPFNVQRMANPDFLAYAGRSDFGTVKDVDFRDYAWFYAKLHGFDLIALHDWPGASDDFPAKLDRVRAGLEPALVSSGDGVSVYDPDRLGPPKGPVMLTTDGWLYGVLWRQWPVCPVSRTARMAAYNPTPGRPLVFTLAARAFRRARRVRLVSGGRDLAVWDVKPDAQGIYISPPFTLDGGRVDFELLSDGEDKPHRTEAVDEDDPRWYSLKVSGVRLDHADATDPSGLARGGRAAEGATR